MKHKTENIVINQYEKHVDIYFVIAYKRQEKKYSITGITIKQLVSEFMVCLCEGS